ncbi:ATP-grasp domain-containing protein [Sphingomonas sp. DT-51]|uniref:ATP-grasp domain-containing protein n=1 Tax=Sphingomonas sp. DT-51 TaxID=3396165 RepID=UPI003F1D4E05
MADLRLLLGSAGRRVALLRCFRESAAALGATLEVHATDLAPEWSAACASADAAHAVPAATTQAYVEATLAICARERIDLLVPTIDTELHALALARDRFAAIGTHVAVADAELVAMARDKLETARFLDRAGVPTPATAAAEAVDAGWRWPAIAKPRGGSSSRGLARLGSLAELAALPRPEPYIVQHLLGGQEYTVNLFFDAAGTLRCAVPHRRVAVRAGEVEKGVTERHDALLAVARRLGDAVQGRVRGAWCFQAFVDAEGAPSVFEINARFGGGYPLAHRAGAAFARWLLEERLGRATSADDAFDAGVTMLRFDDAVFL